MKKIYFVDGTWTIVVGGENEIDGWKEQFGSDILRIEDMECPAQLQDLADAQG